jgi:hypothetical protein
VERGSGNADPPLCRSSAGMERPDAAAIAFRGSVVHVARHSKARSATRSLHRTRRAIPVPHASSPGQGLARSSLRLRPSNEVNESFVHWSGKAGHGDRRHGVPLSSEAALFQSEVVSSVPPWHRRGGRLIASCARAPLHDCAAPICSPMPCVPASGRLAWGHTAAMAPCWSRRT